LRYNPGQEAKPSHKIPHRHKPRGL
jgi:hypothetical protein